MWFSGLRGAIAYALSLHLEFDEDVRKVIVTTTLVVVLFTTICLGKMFWQTVENWGSITEYVDPSLMFDILIYIQIPF